MNPYFKIPGYYRRVGDRSRRGFTELIVGAETEERNAVRRLWEKAVKRQEEPDKQWMLGNFAQYYDHWHCRLFAYVEILLKQELIETLDLATFARLWGELRSGVCSLSEAELREWFENHVDQPHGDQITDLGHDGLSDYPKPEIVLSDLYLVADGLYCVHYRNKRYARYTYIVEEGDRVLLYRVWDGCGRLASESGSIFIQ